MKIDPKKPYNSLPKLPAGIDLTDPELLVKTIETSDAISKLSTQISVGRSRMIASAFHLLTPLFVPEAVSSSGIENIVTTNESVYLAKIKEVRELTSTEKEALNYVDAVTFGLDRLFKREFLVTNDFVDMQKILEPMNSGIRTMPGTHLSNPLTKRLYTHHPTEKPEFKSCSQILKDISTMKLLHMKYLPVWQFYITNLKPFTLSMMEMVEPAEC